jgi:hypothetical protein
VRGFSRRHFFALMAAVPALSRVDLRHFAQVVSIHGDLPYIDRSGAAQPYRPASGGHRRVSESALRSRQGFI